MKTIRGKIVWLAVGFFAAMVGAAYGQGGAGGTIIGRQDYELSGGAGSGGVVGLETDEADSEHEGVSDEFQGGGGQGGIVLGLEPGEGEDGGIASDDECPGSAEIIPTPNEKGPSDDSLISNSRTLWLLVHGGGVVAKTWTFEAGGAGSGGVILGHEAAEIGGDGSGGVVVGYQVDEADELESAAAEGDAAVE